MSVLNRVMNQMSEVKITDVVVNQEIKEKDKFVLICSRPLSDQEKAVLNRHLSGYSDYESRYSNLSLAEIFAQTNCSFLYFNLTEKEDKDYIQSHYQLLSNYIVVCVKSRYDDYNSEWIQDLSDNVTAIVMKTLDNPAVKDSDYIAWIKNFKHIPTPDSLLKCVWKLIKSFF